MCNSITVTLEQERDALLARIENDDDINEVVRANGILTEENVRLRKALGILATRQCGSFCTEKDKDGNERYKRIEDRCAACIARYTLAQGAL